MPEKRTLEQARKDKAEGKSPGTQAGEFVREEIDHIREGKHGARNTKQAIAIGLSKARRAGVDLPQPKAGTTSDGITSEKTRAQAKRDTAKGHAKTKTAPNPKRSRASTAALKREGRSAASKSALSKHAKEVAAKRNSAS